MCESQKCVQGLKCSNHLVYFPWLTRT